MTSRTKVSVTTDGPNTVSAAVLGDLDAEAGRVMREVVATALDHGAERVEIDLRSVRSFTSEGVGDLAAVQTMSNGADNRIVFLADTQEGRAALLAVQMVAVRA